MKTTKDVVEICLHRGCRIVVLVQQVLQQRQQPFVTTDDII